MHEWYGKNAKVIGASMPCTISYKTILFDRRVGELMLKRSRVALLFGVAVAISLIISACGGTTTGNSSTPTPAATASTLGTPGSYNCVSGTTTASGSTALAPLVKPVPQKYESNSTTATTTTTLACRKTSLANVQAGSVDI